MDEGGDDLVAAFGRVLRRLRREKGMSQEELGTIADLHRNYIGQLERGEKNPTLVAMASLASALDISTDELVQRALRQASGE